MIERLFGAIERFRRVAARRAKKAENFLAFARLAAVMTGMS